MSKKSKKSEKSQSCPQTEAFLKVVHELRQKCPWDKKQTHPSLSRYLLEEAYEAAEAMNNLDKVSLKEELGDVLLQVALHSEIASEKKWFDFEEVAEAISEKMIRRHPHVFGDAEVKDYQTHMRNWTRLKQKEKPKKKILEGIPKALPALQLAQRYGEITASVGFDWDKTSAVFKKVKEELKEFEEEVKSNRSKKRIEEELGDLLFSLAQVARHMGLDAEQSLKGSSLKFARRFEKLEIKIKKRGKGIADLSPAELEKEWQSIKKSDSL